MFSLPKNRVITSTFKFFFPRHHHHTLNQSLTEISPKSTHTHTHTTLG